MRAVTTASTHGREPGDNAVYFSSPLLKELIAEIDSPMRHVILVPGAANSGILAMLHGTRSRIVVCDAALAISELDEALDDEFVQASMERLLLDAGSEKIDTVLCWDLLNYMSPVLLKVFANRLHAIMSPGGRLHAYIHSASADMSKVPQDFRLQADGQVFQLENDISPRKTPRYSYGDLEKYMTGIRVERSMLLRNGIQEYLFQLGPD
jgi:hypothetical protein